MDIQRLRNLTTNKLHTKVSDIYEDIAFLTGEPATKPHQLADILGVIEMYLYDRLEDNRFWNDTFDPSHIGEIDIPPMDEEFKRQIWDTHQIDLNPSKNVKAPEQYSGTKRVRIKVGSFVSQDRATGHWPGTASGVDADPNMIFNAKWSGKYWDCRADGFGARKYLGEEGGYGNGPIFAFGIDSVEIID
jgi:hypothetical protein